VTALPGPGPTGHIQQIAGPVISSSPAADTPHILLAVDQLLATLGGGERAVWRLASLLPEYGFRVSILTLAADAQSPIVLDPPCPVFVLPLQRTWDGKAMRAARTLRRFLHEQQVRLVQTFFESSDLWVGGVAKSVPGISLIWSRRDMGILRTAKHRIAYRLLARLPDFVFAVSEQVRRHCIEVDGIQPERVRTVYNGVPVNTSASPESLDLKNSQPPRILSVGNIRRVKGHDMLLEAAALVLRRFPQVEFAIAGEPAEAEFFASLQARAAELQLSTSFHFLGGVSPLAEELRRATLFVMPSRSEGFSNAIVEAMAASLPVVATRVGGNPEAVDDGKTGTLVPAEDVQALAGAICALLGDRELAHQMGIAGHDRVAKLFTTDAMMQATVETYRNLLKP
jgi:L-malate glycosyltransferase